jgi:hypothetical protein
MITRETSSADTLWVIAGSFGELTVDSSTDLAKAKVLDMKPKMTTAVNTRRMRDKRWGYEGIKTRFRGVKIVYPSKSGIANFYEQMFVATIFVNRTKYGSN